MDEPTVCYNRRKRDFGLDRPALTDQRESIGTSLMGKENAAVEHIGNEGKYYGFKKMAY